MYETTLIIIRRNSLCTYCKVSFILLSLNWILSIVDGRPEWHAKWALVVCKWKKSYDRCLHEFFTKNFDVNWCRDNLTGANSNVAELLLLITVNFKLNRSAKNQNHFNYLWAESGRHTQTHTSVVVSSHRITSIFDFIQHIFFLSKAFPCKFSNYSVPNFKNFLNVRFGLRYPFNMLNVSYGTKQNIHATQIFWQLPWQIQLYNMQIEWVDMSAL